MFKDIFGDNPQTKILDFLAMHVNFDYTITDIASYAEVSKPTVYKVLDTLLKKKLVVQTRTIGKSNLYKLNTENNLVKTILKFSFEMSKQIADLEASKTVSQYKDVLIKSGKSTRAKATV